MEAHLLLASVVLSTLVASGYSINCIKCMGLTDTPCTGPEVTCPSTDDVCTLTHMVASFGGLGNSHTVIRDCGKRDSCSNRLSLTNLDGKRKSATSCCYTDKCTPPLPVLPEDSSRPNGVRCKSCTDMTNTPCQSDVFMDCLGEEKKCISQVSSLIVGTGNAVSMSIRACATDDLCDLPPAEVKIGQFTSKMHSTCTDGSSGLRYNVFLLLMSVSLLLKFI